METSLTQYQARLILNGLPQVGPIMFRRLNIATLILAERLLWHRRRVMLDDFITLTVKTVNEGEACLHG